jgi:4'-phosphopantetheinyl transferase
MLHWGGLMEVYWLEQAESEIPAHDKWLSAKDAACLGGLRFAKRRADWRLGRWTAKRALAIYWNVSSDPQTLSKIEIRPATSGAPEVFLVDEPADVVISLSHSSGVAGCAIAKSGALLGFDLEIAECRSEAFVRDYFATEEQALIARADAADRSQLVTLLWSAKESALKALRTGLRLDTRSVIVSPLTQVQDEDELGHIRELNPSSRLPDALNSLCPLHVRCDGGQVFQGWWQHTGSLLRTLVAAPRPVRPTLLRS